ncbi:MAG: hypothetical protein ABI573_11585 [Chloroflexota bacterium]
MNNDRAFERATRDWLEAGSDRTPYATIDAVLLAVRTTPQERDLRIPWRTPTMPKSLRLAAMLAIVAIVGIGASMLLRPSSSVGPAATSSQSAGPSPTSIPSPTTVPSATPLSSVAPSADTARIPHGPLAAGSYTTTVFTPPTSFTVPAGWINSSETSDRITLYFTDTAHQVSIARVIGDPLVYARPNPDYAIANPSATTVAGLPGEQTTFVLSATAAVKSFYPLSSLADSAKQGGDATLELVKHGTEARLITVDVAGTVVVILIQRPIGDTTDFDAMVQVLVESIVFN